MKDQRSYSRMNINLPGTIVSDNKESNIETHDISEEGIAFSIDKKDYEKHNFALGKRIDIQFIEEKEGKSCEIQQCKIMLKHIDAEKDNKILIGARVIKEYTDYKKYVTDKKVSRFITTIRGMKFAV